MSKVKIPVDPMSRGFADASKRTGKVYMPLSRDLAFCECLREKRSPGLVVEGNWNSVELLGAVRRVLSCGLSAFNACELGDVAFVAPRLVVASSGEVCPW